MKRLFFTMALAVAAWCGVSAQESYSGNIVAEEGAWCWFADPRALHYENAEKSINATYLGYIDVHGNVKATQYDWVTGRKTDILIRSYFQPDDHNNPTFVVLPDERVMIFYTRHTDEPKIWYRISQKPGDITALGEEKFLATENNTTYPSPFILSDDPNHIYLCWRGIGWHPTIARITMPDANDDCQFDFGPKQIVQSTGARPYAKYQSNGKDKIYLSYTTGHPDNEHPNWLYFNVIDINQGNGPILRDIKGTELKKIADGTFAVNKTSDYATKYPFTVVDRKDGIRNWVWQIALDENENPVIAYPHIEGDKTKHHYWYGRWTGTEWKSIMVTDAGHAFHQNWNSTEQCYSGGMALDPDNTNDLYVSIPTKDGAYNKDGVYEIWKYTINEDFTIASSEQITKNSLKNNARPFVIPGSKNSPMRLAWMNGDYYYWIVKQGYPKGYPTDIRVDYAWTETTSDLTTMAVDCICLKEHQTLNVCYAMNEAQYEGLLLSADEGKFTYSLGTDNYPVITIGDKSYRSQNRLLTSDDWATKSTGTSGDNHPTKVSTWVLTLTYDGKILTAYRNGLVDQVVNIEGLELNDISVRGEGFNHTCGGIATYGALATPTEVQQLAAKALSDLEAQKATIALESITLPSEIRTDIVLPTSALGESVTWASSEETVITSAGILYAPKNETSVTLTATCGEKQRSFDIKALPRDITKNVRYSLDAPLDLTANTATGFDTNQFGTAPEGLLKGLRSYTVIVTATATTMTKQPRIYDFGSGSGNSLFLRADALSAGIKLNGGTTTMTTSATKLLAGTEYKLAVTFNAATKTTTIYIDGKESIKGTENQSEPYQLTEVAADTRNYIGRAQWWDVTSERANNQDFCGTISDLQLYDVCLTQKEICDLQGLTYEQKEVPEALVNPDFEGTYTLDSKSGVSSDRAIYIPQGWTVSRGNGDVNDLTALKAGDKYFNQFFANKPASSTESNQTYWIRHNWGTPTLTLSQEVRFPAGHYKMSVDVWTSGVGGDVSISAQAEGGPAIKALPLELKDEWQKATLEFDSDGEAITTISLSAVHNTNQKEHIIGFDNVTFEFEPAQEPEPEPEPIKATSIQLDQSAITLTAINETATLTATVLPADAENKTVEWSSNDESIAKVDQNGVVTAVAAGAAIITATTTDGSNLSATCPVTVSITDGILRVGDKQKNPGKWYDLSGHSVAKPTTKGIYVQKGRKVRK